MPPAVALAEPQEFSSVVNPVKLVLQIDPGRVVILEDRAWFDRACPSPMSGEVIGRRRQHHADGVLVPIELLENELVADSRPFQIGDVIVAGIAGHVDPSRLAAARRDHADPARRVLLADLGILDVGDSRIQASRCC